MWEINDKTETYMIYSQLSKKININLRKESHQCELEW